MPSPDSPRKQPVAAQSAQGHVQRESAREAEADLRRDAVRPALQLGSFRDRIVATRELPARQASYAEFPQRLAPQLRQVLAWRGIEKLYCHQAESFDAALDGEHVVVTTGTASGKSLTYLLPVLQSVLDDRAARSLLLFPTKALTQDQLRAVQNLSREIAGEPVLAGVYDGDTPPSERAWVRDNANLILTNPDMLNAALLPNHGRQGFAHIFRNVRYIVVDELHSYRGAFGAHFANLMRRLVRICRHYGSQPTFLCSSATIANAREHAETLCIHGGGRQRFRLIDRDGSPSAGKVIHFWQPKMGRNYQPKAVASEMAMLLPLLVDARHRTIAFCKSRKETEIVLKQARDVLANSAGHDESYLLAGYRGGYTPEERRKVERDLSDGRLLAVVSTNALELGVDIGALEVVVQGGFPGTRASFWQQMGRAGRRQEKAHGILILAVNALDQHIARDPDWLVGQPTEHAVVDRDNLAIQLAHVRAAAAELPLALDDAASFPDLGEILPVLHKAGELRPVADAWHWAGGAFPAGDFSLRNVDRDRFKLVNRGSGRTITEMDRHQVYREAHPRAVYLHDGIQYQVEALDLVAHVATVTEVSQNFYTQPDDRTHIDVLLTQESVPLGRTRAHFGDVRLDSAVVGYKMLEFITHQNLGYEELHEDLRTRLETEAVWLEVPENVLDVLGRESADSLAGLVHALTATMRMRTMAETGDLRGSSFHFVDEASGQTRTAVICHDAYAGGLGYAAKGHEFVEEICKAALELVSHCACKSGCPACVGTWNQNRFLVAWALGNLWQESAVPRALVASMPPQRAPAEPTPRVAWAELAANWQKVTDRMRQLRAYGAEVLAQASAAEVRGARLVITVHSAGLADWMAKDDAKARLQASLARLVVVPAGFAIEMQVATEDRDRAVRRQIKLQRRHDDLTADPATSELSANEKLAGGYLVGSGDGTVN